MSVALPSSTIMPEPFTGIRPDRNIADLPGVRDGANGAANEFSAVLSDMAGAGRAPSDRRSTSVSGSEGEAQRRDAERDSWGREKAAPDSAVPSNMGPNAAIVANPVGLDPTLSVLLMAFPSRAANANPDIGQSNSASGASNSAQNGSVGEPTSLGSQTPRTDIAAASSRPAENSIVDETISFGRSSPTVAEHAGGGPVNAGSPLPTSGAASERSTFEASEPRIEPARRSERTINADSAQSGPHLISVAERASNLAKPDAGMLKSNLGRASENPPLGDSIEKAVLEQPAVDSEPHDGNTDRAPIVVSMGSTRSLSTLAEAIVDEPVSQEQGSSESKIDRPRRSPANRAAALASQSEPGGVDSMLVAAAASTPREEAQPSAPALAFATPQPKENAIEGVERPTELSNRVTQRDGGQQTIAELQGRARNTRDVAPSPAVASVSEADVRTTPSVDDVARETIRGVKVRSLETHLPIELSNVLVAQARSSFGLSDAARPNLNVAIAPASAPVAPPRDNSSPTKLLTIELEPNTLGSVTVKMKMSRSNIDMQIRVESADALRALDAARDRLVDAMQSSGCTVDSCTIQVASQASPQTSSSSTPDGSQSLASGDGQSAGASGSDQGRQEYIDRERTKHGGPSGYSQDNLGNSAEQGARDVATRRTADRVGGVYL